MKSAVFTAKRVVSCQEIDIPQKKQSEVLLRTLLSSICGSDLHVGYYGWSIDKFPLPPGFPGHESICEVVDGNGTNYDQGELVLAVPVISEARSFSEYQVIPERQLVRIDANIPMQEILMAQQLGTVIFASKNLPDLHKRSIVIIGQGSAGLFHTFMSKRLGADNIITVEPIGIRSRMSKRLGADISINSKEEEATKEIFEITNYQGCDVVIDAVGSVETLNQAINVAKPNALILLFGLPTTESKVLFDWSNVFKKNLNLKAIHGSQHEFGLPDFKLACDLINKKEIQVSDFVTHTFKIEETQKAFELVESKEDGVIKTALMFN